MQKILIIGNCGVGKTTFSKTLADKLNLPLVHLDYQYWKPDWSQPTKNDWRATVKSLVSQKSWIIDGNYRSSFDLRVPAADTIIFLDLPKNVALWRIIVRYLKNRGRNRSDIGGNNVEKIDWTFIKRVLNYPRHHILHELNSYKTNQKLFHLRNQKDIKHFLRSL